VLGQRGNCFFDLDGVQLRAFPFRVGCSAFLAPRGDLSSTIGNISSNINNATILGGVTFPIYDGGIRDARIYEARSRASAAEATLLRLQQNAAATEIVAADDALLSLSIVARPHEEAPGAFDLTNAAIASGSESTTPSRTTDPVWFTTQIDICFNDTSSPT
jgi:hypothetical protein